MSHFQLVLTDGEALGARELAGNVHPPGSILTLGKGDQLRVLEQIPATDAETFSILVVERVTR